MIVMVVVLVVMMITVMMMMMIEILTEGERGIHPDRVDSHPANDNQGHLHALRTWWLVRYGEQSRLGSRRIIKLS